ncbi:MAG: hypothetical protein GYB53_21410 [Rhodobacteraceae bacterium]|nr:hypothetical protein [Paracoccaceae bacterium]MBR9823055.1 hypothetical protein [Paracoccaceae bacterium]
MRDHVTAYKPPLERARHVLGNPGAHPSHKIRNAALYLANNSADDVETLMARALVTVADRSPGPRIGFSKRACATITLLALALGTCAGVLLIP